MTAFRQLSALTNRLMLVNADLPSPTNRRLVGDAFWLGLLKTYGHILKGPRAAMIVRFALVATPLLIAITVALSRQANIPKNIPAEPAIPAPRAVITESFKAYTLHEIPLAPVLASTNEEAKINMPFLLERSAREKPRERRSHDICRGRGRTWTTRPSGWRSWRCNRR
jgi:hypothetical protein